MRRYTVKISRISIAVGQSTYLTSPVMIPFNEGQFFLFSSPHGEHSDSKITIFPVKVDPHNLLVVDQLGENLYPGDECELLGPFGRGFEIPAGRNKILLISDSKNSALVLAFANLYSKPPNEAYLYHPELPNLSEQSTSYITISENLLEEKLQWADICLIETDHSIPSKLIELLTPNDKKSTLKVQMLIRKSMPCHSFGNCGLCGVSLKGKKYLLCKDGPVLQNW